MKRGGGGGGSAGNASSSGSISASSGRAKTQLAMMVIPSSEKFVSDYLRREQEERLEKAKMKQVCSLFVLIHHNTNTCLFNPVIRSRYKRTSYP